MELKLIEDSSMSSKVRVKIDDNKGIRVTVTDLKVKSIIHVPVFNQTNRIFEEVLIVVYGFRKT